LPSPAEWRGKKDEKILTAPLTFILSRKGREEMEGKILTELLTLPSPTAGRGKKKMKRFKQCSLILPSHAGWRGLKERKGVLFVFNC
jgi:hypothetical protein